MKYLARIAGLFIWALLIVTFCFTSGNAAEIDDASLFVDAFNAYQQKDYLLTIEKSDQLNQAFPDSPLRDVTLLLIARASLKSGNNERAAKSVTLFSTEFPESSLKTSVESELKVLANRLQKGEVLTADKNLQISAAKVRSDRLARERAAELKLEMERIAKAKAEQERLARLKLEAERREKERLLAEKLARESIKAEFVIPDDARQVSAGGSGVIPLEISNKGKNSEEFFLTLTADKEYGASLAKSDKADEKVTRITLAAGETFKGSITLRMPAEMVDGHRSAILVKAVSAKFSDISFQKEVPVVTSAPLVRAVAKLAKQKVNPGEKLRYRVTVLNAGSLSAQDLSVRLKLPPHIEFIGVQDALYKRESDRTLVFNVEQLEIGKLVEFHLDVMISEESAAGEVLRGQVEVVNGRLQRKEIFTTTSSVVQAK